MSETEYRNDGHVVLRGTQTGRCVVRPGGERVRGYVKEQLAQRAHVTEQLAADREPPVCRKCVGRAPGCCYQLVTSSLLEAVLIMSVERELVLANWERVVQQAAREEQSLRAYPGDPAQGAARHFWGNGTPCVFLTPEGRCGVYRSRPWACVVYAVVEPSRPSHCGAEAQTKVVKYDTEEFFMRKQMDLAQEAQLNNVPVMFAPGLATVMLLARQMVVGAG